MHNEATSRKWYDFSMRKQVKYQASIIARLMFGGGVVMKLLDLRSTRSSYLIRYSVVICHLSGVCLKQSYQKLLLHVALPLHVGSLH